LIAFFGVISFIFFVVMLVGGVKPDLINKKSKKDMTRKQYFKAAGFFFVIVIILMAIDGGNEDNKTTQQTVAQNQNAPEQKEPEETEPVSDDTAKEPEVKEPEPEDKKPEVSEVNPPEDIEEYITWAINEKVGEKSNIDNEKRIRDIEITDQSIFVELMADDNLTTNMIRSGILINSTDVFETVFTSGRTDIPKLILAWDFPMQDAKGNEMIFPVITITMTAENASTFNWENFLHSKLPQTADNYVQHNVFNED
jgi:hypothetical protein